ncbi:hypothetical protein NLG97_g2455 [Lecanicillium saksenae]|uniref:Uncharacterized protein n=1 Tax=Lecanicillium saksenae TaxID=468837 RepID=A0ACC1R235_9HYPO|nr:hypothetical protein NLG97_g2455 [Lecanicillium saksenae]
MVYCGPPSASCGNCRAKKRRCDKASPACGQCVRKGQTCPGYNDLSVLRVRDETTRMIHRTKVINARRAASASSSRSGGSHPLSPSPFPESSSISTPSSEENFQDITFNSDDAFGSDTAVAEDNAAKSPYAVGTLLPSISAPPTTPATTLRALGMNYFLINYVIPKSAPCPGKLNYSLDLLNDPLEDTALVEIAIHAVGLASVASITNASSLMYKARLSYTEALTRVHAALSDSCKITKNSTLFAALILSMFETITCSNDASVEAYRHHIDGIANLLMLRGAEQFGSSIGSQIFAESFSHVIILQSHYGRSVSPRLRLLRRAMEEKFAQKAPSWFLSSVHIDVMDLMREVNPDEETPFLRDRWTTLLSQAVALDRKLEHLFTTLPAGWEFQTIHDPAYDPRIVWQGNYHVYSHAWVGKVWDAMRACRIILQEAIFCLLSREGQEWAPQQLAAGGARAGLLQESVSVSMELRDDILASVPYMLGFVQQDGTLGSPSLVPASGPSSAIWYLHLAGRLPFNTEEIRSWIVDRLRAVRSITGIQKAGYLAESVQGYSAVQSPGLPTNGF